MNETLLANMHHIVLQEGIRIHNSSSKKVFNQQLIRRMNVSLTKVYLSFDSTAYCIYSSFDSTAYCIFKFQCCIQCKLDMKYSNMLLYRNSFAECLWPFTLLLLGLMALFGCGVLEAESCTSFRIGLELSFATCADSIANKPLRINY